MENGQACRYAFPSGAHQPSGQRLARYVEQRVRMDGWSYNQLQEFPPRPQHGYYLRSSIRSVATMP